MTTQANWPNDAVGHSRRQDVNPQQAWSTFIGVIAAVASAILIAADPLHFDHWRWAIVVASSVLVWGFAAPAHAAALRSLRGSGLSVMFLASLSVLGAWALMLLDVLGDRHSSGALLASVIPVALLIVAHLVRTRAGESSEPPPVVVHLLLAGAVVAGVTWAVISGGRAGAGAAVSVLIAAGPASMIIAAPGALELARRKSRPRGIVLGDLASMEATDRVATVILSKDGTVTSGELTVTTVAAAEERYERELRWFAGALSHGFNDQASRAISRLAGRGRLALLTEEPGRGVTGVVDKHIVRIGEPTWIGYGKADDLWHTVAVDVDARPLGTLTLSDVIRDDAAQGVQDLRSLGLDLVLVSQDTEARTRHIAEQVGIASWLSDAAATGLDEVVQQHTHDGESVVVVSAEPVEADVTVCVGDSGRGIGLVDLNVSRIAPALRAARSACRAARRSIIVATSLGTAAAVAAGAGLLGIAGATVAACVGLVVTLASSAAT